MTDKFHRISVVGAGLMASWIIPKFTKLGALVRLYDVEKDHSNALVANMPEEVAKSISIAENLDHLFQDSDLLFETISEDLDIKRSFYSEITKFLDKKTIVTTNSSVMVGYDFLPEDFPKRRFCHFHFYMPNTAIDIMPLEETEPQIAQSLIRLAKALGEEPIFIDKPRRGYLFSAMAGALTDVALGFVHDQVASPEAIDGAWKAITKMQLGPFAMLDQVGLDTSLKIRKLRLARAENSEDLKKAISVLETYVKQGKLGRKTGRGFFSYSKN